MRFILKGTASGSMIKFSNFPREALDDLERFFQANYSLPLTVKQMSLKGFNWGRTDFVNDQMEFTCQDKVAFEIPLAEVANASVGGKNEAVIEFPLDASMQSKKHDSLVEMRLFIPQSTSTAGLEEGKKAEELFCNTFKSLSSLEGAASGEVLVSFPELPALIPRGRFDADLAATHLRLRGKTHDYKILYSSITRLFLLPKPDGAHVFFVVGLEPPLRQGQTRYPYLVFQFNRDDEMELSLSISDEELAATYAGKLQKEYNAPTFEVVSCVFKGLADKKLIAPGSFKSASTSSGFPCIKCSVKANEGFLYPLEKSAMFLTKPTLLINYADVEAIVFARVSAGGVSSSKTFDMKFECRNGHEYSFSNISKEEFSPLEEFFQAKGLKCKNELAQKAGGKGAQLEEVFDDDDSSPDEDYDDDEEDEEEGSEGSEKDEEEDDEEFDE